MKKLLLIISVLILCHQGVGQCTINSLLTSKATNCAGETLSVSSSTSLTTITWKKDGVPVKSVTATAVPATSGVTVAGQIFSGSSLDKLNFPDGIWVDDADNVYIADYYNNRVVKWSPGASAGVVVAGGNGKGNAANQFSSPTSVCFDAAGNMYVADFDNNRVQKWAPGAVAGTTVAGGNGAGTGANQLKGPVSICLDAAGNLYIADFANERVQKWVPGAAAGVTVAGGNGYGAAANQLGNISDVFVDGKGNLYIADASNGRIQKWAPGATAGVTVAGGNGAGLMPNQIGPVFGVWVDEQGNIYASDENKHTVQMWPPGASSGITVAGDGFIGDRPGSFSDPGDLFIDKKGNLYVADEGNYRVQKWSPQYIIDSVYSPAAPGIYTASVTNAGGCTATSNSLTIYPMVTPALTIGTPALSSCNGMLVAFTATPVNGGNQAFYQWQVNGVSTGSNSPVYSSNTLINGDVISCVMKSTAQCLTDSNAISNKLTMTVAPESGAVLTVTPVAPEVCPGTPVQFKATAINVGNNPVYTWQINGITINQGSSQFQSSGLSNGDIVICIVNDNSICGPASSNPVLVKVHAAPAIAASPTIYAKPGQSVIIQPGITGDIVEYQWSPATGLSDSSIASPIVNPVSNTLYTLLVKSVDGCFAMGTFQLKISGTYNIPNAFTPNGDGHNDRFRVTGGSPDIQLSEMQIFNRWGQLVFTASNLAVDDIGASWDGNFRGSPASPGTYVYIIKLIFPDDSRKVYKGLIQMIR